MKEIDELCACGHLASADHSYPPYVDSSRHHKPCTPIQRKGAIFELLAWCRICAPKEYEDAVKRGAELL